MSDSIRFIITTKKPKVLQQMLKDTIFMEYFESRTELNELHLYRGRTMGPEKKWKAFNAALKKFSKENPVVVHSYVGGINESQNIYAYKNGKRVFNENFSFTEEQVEEYKRIEEKLCA